MILNMVGVNPPFNFSIVGGTVTPINPSENTIWINTDTNISDWFFGPVEPEDPTEGMVWIYTGNASPVSFNALRKNTIQICPLSAKQYITDSWVLKEAQTYQSGEWVNWIQYMFDSENQYEAITGGWSSSGTYQDGINSDDGWNTGARYRSSEVYGASTLIGDTLEVHIRVHDSSNNGAIFVGTKNAINLTPYSKITVDCIYTHDGTAASQPIARVSIHESLRVIDINGNTTAVTYIDIPEGTNTVELDVSALSGNYHIVIGGWTTSAVSLHRADIIATLVGAE